MKVFDGHNDCLLRLYQSGVAEPEKLFFIENDHGHLDLPRARRGGFAGGFFAIYVPGPKAGGPVDAQMTSSRYDLPLPTPLDRSYATDVTLRMAGILLRIAEQSNGAVEIIRNGTQLRHCIDSDTLAAIFHIEGAEAIDPDLHLLDILFEAGLRSIGPVWSRNNIFAHGVPFRYPSTPDIGDGLTDLGKKLIRHCNAKRILIDLSHLNEKGFWDVASLSTAPLVASHSNAHVLSAQSRNLTDRQLDAIRESRGLVGVNYATAFLREDGQRTPDTPIADIVRHIVYLVEKLGEDKVGLGSDFDGAVIPAELGDVAGLPKLVSALRAHGFDDATLEKICWRNWVDVISRTIG
jgi:membrane dipeptidase